MFILYLLLLLLSHVYYIPGDCGGIIGQINVPCAPLHTICTIQTLYRIYCDGFVAPILKWGVTFSTHEIITLNRVREVDVAWLACSCETIEIRKGKEGGGGGLGEEWGSSFRLTLRLWNVAVGISEAMEVGVSGTTRNLCPDSVPWDGRPTQVQKQLSRAKMKLMCCSFWAAHNRITFKPNKIEYISAIKSYGFAKRQRIL